MHSHHKTLTAQSHIRCMQHVGVKSHSFAAPHMLYVGNKKLKHNCREKEINSQNVEKKAFDLQSSAIPDFNSSLPQASFNPLSLSLGSHRPPTLQGASASYARQLTCHYMKDVLCCSKGLYQRLKWTCDVT